MKAPRPPEQPKDPEGVVDRCVCVDVSFAALKRLRERERLDLAGLKARTGCCGGCTMCEPYVRLMLRTGRTEFAVLTPVEAAALMRAADAKEHRRCR